MEPTTPIRVLVVDDSVVIRRLLTAVLDAEPDLEVVGYSTNGRLALSKIEQLEPDVVSLDVMMPEMDGIECVREIRERFGDLPVVMFSSLTEEGAAVTMDALAAGANDFVTKPWKTDGFADAVGQVSDQLVGRIRALHGARGRGSTGIVERTTEATPRAPLPTAPASPVSRRGSAAPIGALVIGASTGGPNALDELLTALPGDLGVPILVTQHMPPMFTRLLAERLEKHSAFTAGEATDGEALRPNHVLVAPGDFHLSVKRDGASVVTALDQEPPINSCRPSVEPLFASAREVWGGNLLCVVLTGMGHDGVEGATAIHAAGGQVLAQDEASSVVWGMPRAVAEAGIVDAVLPLDRIAAEIASRIRSGGGRLAGGSVG